MTMTNRVRRNGTVILGSLVDVTQSLIHNVHQLIEGILVHNTIRQDRWGELREDPLTKKGFIKTLRTFMKGGPPFGKTEFTN